MIAAFQTSDVCGDNARSVCRFIYDKTDNELLSDLAAWLVSRLAAVVIVLALTYVVVRLVRRGAPRVESAWLERRALEAKRLHRGDVSAATALALSQQAERTKQRTHTLRLVITSVLVGVVWFIAGLAILDQVGINLAPLLAGAGVVGIALGFGAQSMVKDFLAGLFIVLEDQYGVGDVVDIGPATGVVEQVNLRATRLRDVAGVVWYVPNGEITRVANMSQLWSKAVIDIGVAYETDIDYAAEVFKAAADDLWQSQLDGATIIEEPTYLGVERFEADGIVLRLVIKTEPNEQWTAARELRRRLKIARRGRHRDSVPPANNSHSSRRERTRTCQAMR
ncbi:MAG: mechanosensitive ion channel family protein [Acidimicrobiales bacterium]